MRRTLSFLLSVTLLASCTVGPKYKRPEVTVPDQFRGASASQSSAFADTAWWGGLTDDALRGLIEDAVKNGYDVRLAAWRVEEARANAGIAASELYPAIQGSAGWSKTQQAFFPFQFQLPSQELYSVNIGLSWEIDLWGRIRHLKEAALARYLATEEARRGVQISLVSDVAAGYFQLRALDFQLEIAKRTSEAFRGTQGLFQRRLEAGLASTLETASATASLATTNATIPELERRIAEQENRLSLLIGHPPREVPRGAPLEEQLLPPEVPIGLPSDLLKRRPDILEAEQQLVAANAQIGVATADYFPRIALTAVGGSQSSALTRLFAGPAGLWTVGVAAVQPVFEGGRIRNRVRFAEARVQEVTAVYQRTVQQAFREVADALVGYRKSQEVRTQQQQLTNAAEDATRLSNMRYRGGAASYLEVLDSETRSFTAQLALAQAELRELQALVEIYRSLGGGWE